MAVTYRPAENPGGAGWLLAVAGRAALLYRAADGSQASELLAALSSADAVQGCLDILTRGGLTATPEFAMASWASASTTDAVLLVRGAASAAATTATGDVRLDGSTVSTWHEQRVAGVTSIELGRGIGRGDGLPLIRGVVPAEGAVLSRDAVSAPDEAAKDKHETGSPVAPVSVPAAPAIVEATITELAEAIPPVSPASTAAVSERPSIETAGYAHLFEETIVRSIEDAAVRPPSEDESADEAAPPRAGDHDGMTIMSGDLAQLRALGGRAEESESVPVSPPAPPRFVLAVSNGTTESVTGTVLVGRSPSVAKVSSGQVPRLVSITGDQDISRNHAQFALEGDTVVVTDLHSRNGTSIVLPGHAPQILRPGEPTPIIAGTLVDLGGGTTMTLRDESVSDDDREDRTAVHGA